MNRRLFVGSLLGSMALDHEKLLWVRGKKLISIPAPRIYRVLLVHRDGDTKAEVSHSRMESMIRALSPPGVEVKIDSWAISQRNDYSGIKIDKVWFDEFSIWGDFGQTKEPKRYERRH